jgi:rubrerythrin
VSIFREYRMRCDYCGRIDPLVDINEKYVWRQLRGNGWTRKLAKDVCPSCNGSNEDYWSIGF